jgi:uncharacterized membrane protein YuzA (DUF378 family)
MIKYDSQNKVFYLNTKTTTYAMGLFQNQILVHLYWGKRINPTLKKKSVDAPVKKGDVLGTAEILYAEQVIGTVNLVAGEDVSANGLLKFFDIIRKIFTSLVFKIIFIIIELCVVIFFSYVVYINTKDKKRKRRVKYIPYDEEKELLKKEKIRKKREKAGRPEYRGDIDDE